eukprot:JZ549356.1.p5 GENE.JZ549356.1~~JZ549356.1.p5  ORF type:complete len:59 (-),score=2.41 JZ549356.1:361-537(-)
MGHWGLWFHASRRIHTSNSINTRLVMDRYILRKGVRRQNNTGTTRAKIIFQTIQRTIT